MNADNKKISEHILSYFNEKPKVMRYWNEHESKNIDLLSCLNTPYNGVQSVSTIGLFNTDIGLTYNKNPLRVELLAACDVKIGYFNNIISTLAFEIMDKKTVYPGLVVPNILPIYIKSSALKHILLTYPFLWNIQNVLLDNLSVTWLMAVPISEQEKIYVESNGLDAIETVFEEQQIDIFNIYRNSAI